MPIGEPKREPHRLDSVDLLRGIVMVLMALDHTRDFFSNAAFDPLDLTRTNEALFLTRWITHFCAPVFMLLAGTGAYLSLAQGKSKRQLARFLFTRGLWLVLLELTVVHFGWYLNFDFHFELAQVIWALGWCMVALAGLVFLPTWAVTLFAIVMIAGHNLFDGVRASSFSSLDWLWIVLHTPGSIRPLPDVELRILYPLVPWIGVMAAGYGLGALMVRAPRERRTWLLALGIVLTVGFIILRATNVYGDPHPWSLRRNLIFTIFSFVNTEKYPPSLLYLLMTLGPALVALAYFDRAANWLSRPWVIFGRAPLFYYLIHLPLIHALAIVLNQVRGYDLPIVYLVWIGVVALLFPLCRWYVRLKQRQRNAWLSYL